MHVYRCQLRLMEKLFFSSREISNCYYTEPLIGNYALAYALGFCEAPYYNDGSIYYGQHLGALNERDLYITPATILGDPQFHMEQFNAQPDTYWFQMGRGVLITDREEAERAANRPQFGRIRFLAAGNEAVFYLISREAVRVASYIRLGKFMSKAAVEAREVSYERKEAQEQTFRMLLNPADLPEEAELRTFDLITVPPSPLVQNAHCRGPVFHLETGEVLPAGMSFGLDGLEAK